MGVPLATFLVLVSQRSRIGGFACHPLWLVAIYVVIGVIFSHVVHPEQVASSYGIEALEDGKPVG